MDLDQTIAALASPPGPAARGIIRISGSDVAAVIDAHFAETVSELGKSPGETPRQTPLAIRRTGTWSVADSPVRIPCDLLYWPNHRSYTGQPTAELHLPGSPPLLEHVLADLYRRGVRPARPGEFTLRSFLAGKIDLLQAEAVLGVIDAHHDAELQTALEQLAGGISGLLAQLRGDLIDLLADLEAGLDFVEEDIEFVPREELSTRVTEARRFVDSLISQSDSRMTSAALPKVVLAGLPNAGKSTLFNRLAGKPLALVSSQEGTTRDYLRAELNWDGVRFELIDTAGWEEVTAGIAALAQSQRAEQFQRADLILWCSARNQDESQQRRDETAFSVASAESLRMLRVWTKADRAQTPPSGGREPPGYAFPHSSRNQGADAPRSEELRISAMTGFGCDELRRRLTALLADEAARSSAWLGMTAARCRDSLDQAAAALSRAEETAARPAQGDELLAIDLRDALDHLGQTIGAVYTNDLLDRIFSKFCIGK